MERDAVSVACFSTELGWFALVSRRQNGATAVSDLLVGYPSSAAAWVAAHRAIGAAGQDEFTGSPANAAVDDDRFAELRRRFQRYAAGERVDFSDVRLAHPPLTAFQRRVLDACRAIPYGECLPYAKLAELAGYPRAARAAGNVMAGNRVPILIPCHRVVAAGGRLGGYSSPQGIGLKARLLELEGCRSRLPGRTLMAAYG